MLTTWLLHYVSSPIVEWPVINSVPSQLLVLIVLNRWGLIDVRGTAGLCDSASKSLRLGNLYLLTILIHLLITIWLLGFIEV